VKVLVVASITLFFIGLATPAAANSHHRHAVRTDYPYAAPYWAYHKWVPWGAYQTRVIYGPGNRRCVSQLVLLQSGWWRPTRRCEVVVSG